MSREKKYILYSYSGKEPELEKLVIEMGRELFGENSFVFPKKLMSSRKTELGTLPDGYVLDVSDPDNPILYVMEVELKTHGLEHIATQILKFAIAYKESKPPLNKYLKGIIRSNPDMEKRISERLKESKRHKYLDQLIDDAMEEDVPNVIVPIDGLDESLKKIQDYVGVPIRYIPIETYINAESGETIHHIEPLYQLEEAAKPTEIGTFYQFNLKDVKVIDIPRIKFDEEHRITRHAQGYTFIRDKDGEPTGVLFWWYRNRVERHIKEDITEDGQSWAGTARPIDPSSYKLDMDVYVGETMYDRDTGQKVDDPKYRIRGKLKEIQRIDGGKKTKIFPA
nr:hypothetical protein [Candidatus Njordarchaeota archaeon]